MRVVLVSVRDAMVGFSAPQQEVSSGSAIRSFLDAVEASGSFMGKHTADFSLWKIGEFDMETGDVYPCMEKLCAAGDGGARDVLADAV